ncbi:MAG: hypothetical protein ACI9KE_002627 [Polyangiales bacterium]|jgi:hypothetical protein
MMRSVLLVSALLAVSCGSSDPDAFILELVSASTDSGRSAVALSAVDEIRVRLDPVANVRFDARSEMLQEGGDLLTRVSAEGEFIVTLLRPYLDSYATVVGDGFSISLPLAMESSMSGTSPAPILVIEFIQRNSDGTETIAVRRDTIPWPITSGSASLVLSCTDGFEPKCANERP